MHRTLMVIRREYLDRVKKKSFWIGLAIFPILMGALIFGQIWLAKLNPEEQRKIAIIDATGRLAAPVEEKLKEEKLKNGEPSYLFEEVRIEGDPKAQESLDAARRQQQPRVSSSEIFGIMTIGPDLGKDGNFSLYVRNAGNIMATETIRGALRDAVIGVRLEDTKLSIDRAALDKVIAHVDLETFQVSEGEEATKKDFLETYFGTFAFVMLLYMSLLIYGIAVMRGILEEKSNRVMEVLLGPLTPNQLMSGKIFGIGLVGLTQMVIYLLIPSAIRLYIVASQVTADWTKYLDVFSPLKMVYLIIFFLLGYFFYVGLFAAIGAVCNTEQEAQNLQSPVTMCLIVPMVATFFFVNNPDSTAAVVMSMIPLFAPMVMFMRICVLMPPFWQIALSIVLCVGSIWLLFRGVAKVFRIGILMYGKRPTIPEIIRWARR